MKQTFATCRRDDDLIVNDLDAMWEGRGSKPDWSKTELAHSFSPKEHANGCA